ncbi:MAG: thymidine phosphorylase [Pseudomonadota bacterium]
MNVPQLIIKKRNNGVLAPGEVRHIIEGFTDGSIPGYQISALLMAIYFRGMKEEELDVWTDAMIGSGGIINLDHLKGAKIDKHSTGGVGDKVSLALAPLVASCGVLVPMISGRGLGHTGGTLDKLESLGMDVTLSAGAFLDVLEKTGLVFAGQTENIVPADRKLYALRDVTGTVESVPLIASSIMSKKLAEGIEGLVLDIKVGEGAFMRDIEKARELAGTMIRIGKGRGVKVKAVMTAMDQPLGRACGNGIEAAEAIDMLRGKGPDDFREVTLHLSAWMLVLGGAAAGIDEAKKMCERKIAGGEALERLKQVVALQGGDAAMVDDPTRCPVGEFSTDIHAAEAGWVTGINARAVGYACIALGAGRVKAEDNVDFGAGIYLHRKAGERVDQGEKLATLYSSMREKLEEASTIALGAFETGDADPGARGAIILDEM